MITRRWPRAFDCVAALLPPKLRRCVGGLALVGTRPVPPPSLPPPRSRAAFWPARGLSPGSVRFGGFVGGRVGFRACSGVSCLGRPACQGPGGPWWARLAVCFVFCRFVSVGRPAPCWLPPCSVVLSPSLSVLLFCLIHPCIPVMAGHGAFSDNL